MVQRWMSTLEAMIECGTHVTWSCRKCGAWGSVYLPGLIELLGEDGSLWDRHPPCPRAVAGLSGCEGLVLFLASADANTPTRPLQSIHGHFGALPLQAWMGGWTGMQNWRP